MYRTLTAVALAFALAPMTRGSLAAQAPRLGTIDFPTSASGPAQEAFTEGVLYLHSFEYGPAAQAFRRAQALDPDFAIAYWGEAMTYNHPLWAEQDLTAARAALERLAATREARLAKAPTDREKAYLAAVETLYGEGTKLARDSAYAGAMRDLAGRFPDDPDAQAFYALSILGTSHGGRDIPTYMRAAAIVEEVFDRHPRHPGAVHYLIHSYDDPIHAPLGLRAARVYSEIAPDAAHAQHMTTHIFVALGMWDEVVSQNTIAAELTNWRSGHYTYWLEYGYLQQGRYREALAHLQAMRRDTEHHGGGGRRWHLIRMRADYVVNTRAWNSPVLDWKIDPTDLGVEANAVEAYLHAFAATERGRRDDASRAIARLAELAREGESDDPEQRTAVPAILEQQVRALVAATSGDIEAALGAARDAARLEAATPFEFGPPVMVKPSHELLGELLLRADQPAAAQRAFTQALARTPKRALSLMGLAEAAELAGDTEAAHRARAELKAVWHRADPEVAAAAAGAGR